ncbi:hypothetical protein VKI22_08450 [Cyanobacterium aponinum UTEX 3221]|uniref:Uncharacterized protein n=1 Tax=Cyanobacterium aponinum 0216 TaxID=2676140 RepID=A0A844H0S0_9CHRO|nr:hypothetical protein [Cyanobacterium aponinum]MTF39965.1 hypothetical protein [Cyanobacterium aponinum 0216]PHV62466.1 hypothetical protein CSQ80_10130 [Cyanobacterium aponinum IPPAS B-1201]WRL40092.1 hypothetical protein VKI22_08450 [Cyanobacterium aponinum UTEX 3221]
MNNKKVDKPYKKPVILSWFCEWYLDRIFISRIMAIISALNLLVVAFDITYIPLRDIWLNGKITLGKFKIGPYEYEGLPLTVLPQKWSQKITQYDVIKGIEPNRDTQTYLKEVSLLEDSINQYGLNSPETEEILAKLREYSEDMIEQNPFAVASKSGTLEVIKNRMRDHMNKYIDNPEDSAKLAFDSFWTTQHLQKQFPKELNFFNEQIKPLIKTNYYRPIGENGEFIDYFGLIDFPFIIIIFIDFIIRCLGISFRYHGVNFKDAIFWRWYDLIFFLPKYRWLRIIPVTIRLDEAKLLDSKRIKKQASQGFVAGIAGDITEVVILRIVNQIQSDIKKGQIEKMLIPKGKVREYVDLNDINEIAEITKLVIDLVVKELLPEIRNEVEVLLAYTIEKTIIDSPIYPNIKSLPNFNKVSQNLSQRLANRIYQVFLETINNFIKEDPIFEQYLEKIIAKFGNTLTDRPNAKYDINKIEQLLVALLEEIKVNYIQNLSDQDIEALLDETRALRSFNE